MCMYMHASVVLYCVVLRCDKRALCASVMKAISCDEESFPSSRRRNDIVHKA